MISIESGRLIDDALIVARCTAPESVLRTETGPNGMWSNFSVTASVTSTVATWSPRSALRVAVSSQRMALLCQLQRPLACVSLTATMRPALLIFCETTRRSPVVNVSWPSLATLMR